MLQEKSGGNQKFVEFFEVQPFGDLGRPVSSLDHIPKHQLYERI